MVATTRACDASATTNSANAADASTDANAEANPGDVGATMSDLGEAAVLSFSMPEQIGAFITGKLLRRGNNGPWPELASCAGGWGKLWDAPKSQCGSVEALCAWGSPPNVELHLDVADGAQPEHLLGTRARREVVVAQAEATAIDADAVADACGHVDGEVHDLHVAAIVLVGSEGRGVVPMRVELAEDPRHAELVVEQKVACEEPRPGPARTWMWVGPDVEGWEEGLGQDTQCPGDISNPSGTLHVSFLTLSGEEVRQTMVENGHLEKPHQRLA
eukprot:CAMPEP_0177512926 /NCGR_PEP_ID=MMETSP0369-20130122/43493_1 /TAXON_ID=447022 ORGANISM="Scrippsiella hangoei-like, Strain SHHI-4" /NCGR_SAMPLE_ID=MMETSP0369 /ASSEMBLY_ACC=CAM_ASM_000364 /LENGTH=273 /DNA_ID=CAMNT_0018991481 /DNA_START=232 /DNA_END=1056 /DNA_ORIENTATION=-